MFVTFKAHRSRENRTAIQELVDNMETNFENYEDIKERFSERFGNLSPEQLLAQDYGQFLLAPFPKIVFGFGSNNQFIVTCPRKFIYVRSNPHRPDYQIIKFIFSFEPLNPSQTFSSESRRSAYLAEFYHNSVSTDLTTIPEDVDTLLRDAGNLPIELVRDCENIINQRKPFGL